MNKIIATLLCVGFLAAACSDLSYERLEATDASDDRALGLGGAGEMGGADSDDPSGNESDPCSLGQGGNQGGDGGACGDWRACPAGTYLTELGRYEMWQGDDAALPVCARCLPGEYCAGGEAAPQTCTEGNWDDDADPATACVYKPICVAGERIVDAGDALTPAVCEACPFGTFSSEDDALECTPWSDCGESLVLQEGSATCDEVCWSPVVDVTAGHSHSCALHASGILTCWGDNSKGELGDGTKAMRFAPVVVSGLDGRTRSKTAVAVSSGSMRTCVVLGNGSLRCWGLNEAGKLGDGTTKDKRVPTLVSGLDGSSPSKTAVAVSISHSHTCAVLGNGSLSCWGLNEEGQLGDGSSKERHIPTAVSGLDGSSPSKTVVAVGVGDSFTCAVLGDGSVSCWGANEGGQLGNGTTKRKSSPTAVSGLDGSSPGKRAVALATGAGHTCAVLGDGSVSCWGWNEEKDDTVATNWLPTPVSGLDGRSASTTAVELGAGDYSTCAVLGDESVSCWGNNSSGQLSDRRKGAVQLVATQSSGLDGSSPSRSAVAVAGGQAHACVALGDGNVSCWGDNRVGQQGGYARWIQGVPASVDLVPGGSVLREATMLSSSLHHTCAVLWDGSVVGWGNSNEWNDPDVFVPLPGLPRPAAAVSVGLGHMCAVLVDGGLYCWGSNVYGQLGDGTTTQQIDPTQVIGLDGSSPANTAVAVEVDSFDTCAVLGDGSVSCWGSGKLSPRPVSGLDGSSPAQTAVLIRGALSPCALLGDGSVRCWESGKSTPAPVSGLDGSSPAHTAVALSSSGSGAGRHACVVLGDGSVSCWGANEGGQLGDGSTTDRTAPSLVSGLDGSSPAQIAVAVSTGWHHSCALLADGHVSCWGSNSVGELGNGTMTSSSVPVSVSGLEKYAATPKQLFGGELQSFVVLSDGSVLGWGDNQQGQVNGRAEFAPPQVVRFE